MTINETFTPTAAQILAIALTGKLPSPVAIPASTEPKPFFSREEVGGGSHGAPMRAGELTFSAPPNGAGGIPLLKGVVTTDRAEAHRATPR